MIRQIDYKEKITYVIGHKSPDSDSVGSAIAYAYLLNQLGIKAEAAVSAIPNKETLYALKEIGINIPKIITDATDKQFVLVDHSEYSQAIDNMNKARVVSIIDHHEIGNIADDKSIYVRNIVMGSTASIIYFMYKEFEIEIPVNMARVMLMSLISDTSNGKKKMIQEDYIVYDDLTKLSNIDVEKLYNGMVEASMCYDGMTYEEIFKSDYKEYYIGEKKIGISSLDAIDCEKAKELAKQMYKYMIDNYDALGMDLLFAKIDNKDKTTKERAYMVAYREDAVKLLNKIYNNYDGELLFVFKKSISRKIDVIPAITNELNNL